MLYHIKMMKKPSTKYLTLKRFIFASLFLICAGYYSSAQYKSPRGGRSAITGRKFNPNKKKALKKKKPRNYINSIKGYGALGSSNYFGDLCDGFDCAIPKMMVGFGGIYRINESLSTRASFNFIRLAGSDVGGINASRNLSFRSNNFELGAHLIYDIFEYKKMYRRRNLFSPYISLGIGMTYFNPKAQASDGKWHALQPLKTEGVDYGRMTLVIPYGIGARFKITPHLDISADMGYRWAFTDYLDDVSSSYFGPNYQLDQNSVAYELADRRRELEVNDKFTDEQLRQRTIRGNPLRNDGYFLFSIRAEYTLKITHQTYNINSNVSRFRIIRSIKTNN